MPRENIVLNILDIANVSIYLDPKYFLILVSPENFKSTNFCAHVQFCYGYIVWLHIRTSSISRKFNRKYISVYAVTCGGNEVEDGDVLSSCSSCVY